MKTPSLLLPLALALFVTTSAHPARAQNATPEADFPIPAVLQAGLALWPKGAAPLALETWQKGGLLEGDPKVGAEIKYFKRLDPVIGNYRSSELVRAQKITETSQLVYLVLNFDRGAVYARFLLYRPDQNWVVQNMDFSTRPERIVPWLAFAGPEQETGYP